MPYYIDGAAFVGARDTDPVSGWTAKTDIPPPNPLCQWDGSDWLLNDEAREQYRRDIELRYVGATAALLSEHPQLMATYGAIHTEIMAYEAGGYGAGNPPPVGRFRVFESSAPSGGTVHDAYVEAKADADQWLPIVGMWNRRRLDAKGMLAVASTRAEADDAVAAADFSV